MIIKIVLIFLIFTFGCQKAPNCVTNPLSGKDICSVDDLQDKSLYFEQHTGFKFSLDTNYLSDGRIVQDIDEFLFDEVEVDQIKEFRKEPIQALVFVGDFEISNEKLITLYGIKKKLVKKTKNQELSLLFSQKKNRIIGKLEYYPFRKRFVMTIE